MPSNTTAKNTSDLLRALLLLKDEAEAGKFLRDLLTAKELKEFGNRFLAARLLHDNIAYTQIQQQTGLSTTTIARISKWLKAGAGGYRMMIRRFRSS